jgi:hypothetical protein
MACKGSGVQIPSAPPQVRWLSAIDRPRIPALAQQIRSNRQCAANPLVQGGGNLGHHCGGRLLVDPAHRTAGAAVAAPAGVPSARQ